MIGIWYFNPISGHWLLFEETGQDGCSERLAAIKAILTCIVFKIARRRPTAASR